MHKIYIIQRILFLNLSLDYKNICTAVKYKPSKLGIRISQIQNQLISKLEKREENRIQFVGMYSSSDIKSKMKGYLSAFTGTDYIIRATPQGRSYDIRKSFKVLLSRRLPRTTVK